MKILSIVCLTILFLITSPMLMIIFGSIEIFKLYKHVLINGVVIAICRGQNARNFDLIELTHRPITLESRHCHTGHFHRIF